MKKAVLLCGVATAAMLAAGCSFVGLGDETPNWHETRALSESYEVTNPKAQGNGSIHQISLIFFPLVKWGGSYEEGYQDVLQQNPGSDDIINVRSNVTGVNFLFYQRYDVNIYGATIKYTSKGKGNPDVLAQLQSKIQK